ncbi:MAG: hypothetical protein ACHQ1H_01965 [Nitrososphaerales archaeon]
MLKRRLEAAEEDDEIVLTYLRLAGGKEARRLQKRHEELLHQRLHIRQEMNGIWEIWETGKKNNPATPNHHF